MSIHQVLFYRESHLLYVHIYILCVIVSVPGRVVAVLRKLKLKEILFWFGSEVKKVLTDVVEL